MGSGTSKLGNTEDVRKKEVAGNQLEEEKDWELIDYKNPEYMMDVESTQSLTGAVLVLSIEDRKRKSETSEVSDSQEHGEEKQTHLLIDPLCSEYYGLNFDFELNQAPTYLKKLEEFGKLSKEVLKLCKTRLSNQKLYSLFLKTARNMADELITRGTILNFQKHSSQYFLSRSQTEAVLTSPKKKEKKKFSLIRPFRNATRKLELCLFRRKKPKSCNVDEKTPSLGCSELYKTAAFCYHKPKLAKELVVSTFRLIKVSHDAGIWTWRSIRNIIKPRPFLTNS